MCVARYRFRNAPDSPVLEMRHTVVVDESGQEWLEVLGSDLFVGPGDELKSLLRTLGFSVTPGCECNRHARHMDKMGCDWCEQNIATIVGWLQEEHSRQKMLLPFIPMAAEQVVRLAIRRARKKGNK